MSSSSQSCPLVTMRDVYLEQVRKKYPDFIPRNDFDILSASSYAGPAEGLYTYLDKLFAEKGGTDEVVRSAQALLAVSADNVEVTGRKPPVCAPTFSVRLRQSRRTAWLELRTNR